MSTVIPVVAVPLDTIALADVAGFHGVAMPASVLAWSAMGAAAAYAGHLWNRRTG